MIHHPVVVGIKLVLLVVMVVVLVSLYGVLSPAQFGLAVLISVAVFLGLVVLLWIIVFKLLGRPDSKLARQMILSHQARSEDGYVASRGEFASMVGERGVSLSALRPAGTARFGNKRISVVSEGDFISKGAEIEIVSVTGSRVVVRSASKPDDSQ